MPAPSNTTAPTAIDIGTTLPYTTTQTVDDAGTTYTVWYKYTVQAGITELGILGFGDLSVYKPSLFIYTGPDTAPVLYHSGSAPNKGVQIPVTPGTEYFFKFVPNAGNPTPASLAISILEAPALGTIQGSLLVPDDTDSYPAVQLSAVDGSVEQFYTAPAGEWGDQTDAGLMILHDSTADNFAVMNASVVEQSRITIPTTDGGLRLRINRETQTFWVGNNGSGAVHAFVTTIDSAGNLGPTTWDLGAVGLSGLTTSPNESILYYGAAGPGGAVKRYDLVNNVPLSDLVAGIVGYIIVDFLTINDGSIVVLYYNSGSHLAQALHYDSSGATIRTYSLGACNASPKLAYAFDHPLSFWTWTHNSTHNSIFTNFRLSDGATLVTFTIDEYSAGNYQPPATATPLRFGNSASCPLIVLRTNGVPPGTITVNKVLDDPTGANPTFAFTAGGGLSPASFNLQDGDSQVYDPVAAGSGYSIAETADPDYTTTYVVSNGSPINNISVGAGEDVVVTVTNSRKGSITVGKVTDPYSPLPTFDFTADSPLSPLTFSLLDSQEQVFADLAPGTYSLRESSNPNYTPTYLISNTTSISQEAIVVGAGENVAVFVLNELQALYTGLYQLVPGKRHETLVNQNKGLIDKKIPPPFFITGVIQDK